MDETARTIEAEIPRLRRYAAALTGDPARTDDLVEAALGRGLYRRAVLAGPRSLRGRLLRDVYRCCVESPCRPPTGAERDNGILRIWKPQTEAPLALQAVLAAVYRLPAEQRAALALVELEGMECDEVGHVLGIPASAAHAGVSAARDTLRGAQEGAAAWSAWQRRRG